MCEKIYVMRPPHSLAVEINKPKMNPDKALFCRLSEISCIPALNKLTMPKTNGMKNAIAIFALSFLGPSVFAQEGFTRADSLRGGQRPERTNYDLTYYDLEVEVDPYQKTVQGTVAVGMKQLVNEETQRIQLDLFKNMNVYRIYDENGKELLFEREENAIWITGNKNVPVGKVFEINVEYGGQPIAAKMAPWDGGFDWKEDEKGNPWVGVACEGIGASLWWPNKDQLLDEPDSMRIGITVPGSLMAVSNGNLESKEELPSGKMKYNWKVSYPINNYNVSIYIGKYIHFKDVYQGSEGPYDLDYYVLSYNEEKARKQFEQVKPMFDCYEKFLGPYPFPRDGFALVETPYLGMEHQSAVAYGNKYKNGYLGRDISGSGLGLLFDYIIIHETGHEYWGNSVGMSDLADMWINEGFCTYSEALYMECLYGLDTAMKYCNGWKFRIANDKPIIGAYGVNNEGSGDMYPKAAIMLHTLRWLVNNDELWFKTIKDIQRDFRNKTVSSPEMISYMNTKLGKDYTWVFDQYLRNAKPPKLVYTLQEKGKNLEMVASWTDADDNFVLPIKLMKKGEMIQEVVITSKEQTITIPKTKLGDFSIDMSHSYFLTKKN